MTPQIISALQDNLDNQCNQVQDDQFCNHAIEPGSNASFSGFKRLERSFVWTEFWHEKESDEPYQKPIFKTTKTNFPKNYKIPNVIKTFVNSFRSELLDCKNRNKAKKTFPQKKLKLLVNLQSWKRKVR